jgi:hypothetical protein
MTVTEFRRAARTQRLSIYFQLVTRNAEHAFRLLFPPFLNILNDVPFSAEFPEGLIQRRAVLKYLSARSGNMVTTLFRPLSI